MTVRVGGGRAGKGRESQRQRQKQRQRERSSQKGGESEINRGRQETGRDGETDSRTETE